MIGIDTNVLVRYIAQDDIVQSARATKFIEKECTETHPGFIGLITLAELVWVCESCYKSSKKELITLLRRILSTRQLLVQNAETAWQALRLYESGDADFSDCMVERIAAGEGCEATVTFDKFAAKVGMTLLK